MANDAIDLIIQANDTVTVTLPDASTLTGTFVRWFPNETASALQITVPDTPDLSLVTSTYYIKDYIHVQKLTPTDP